MIPIDMILSNIYSLNARLPLQIFAHKYKKKNVLKKVRLISFFGRKRLSQLKKELRLDVK